MDKNERAQILRDRFRALGGFPFPKSTRPPKPRFERRKETGSRAYLHGEALRCGVKQEWVMQPDAKPEPFTPSHFTRPSPLTKIAAQLPAKLPRVLFDL